MDIQEISICTNQIALHTPPFKKKILNYPLLFLSTRPAPVSSLPSGAILISFPPQQRPSPGPISSPASPPSPGLVSSPSPLRHCPFPAPPPTSHLLLLLPQHPSPTPRHLLSSGAPQLSGTGFQRSPPFRHRSAKQDQTKGLCSVLFSRTEGHGPTKALRSVKQDRTEALRSVKQDRTEALRSVLFDQTVPEGRGRWEPERAGAGESEGRWKRAGAGEWGKGAGKGEEMGGRGAMTGREKGWYRRGDV